MIRDFNIKIGNHLSGNKKKYRKVEKYDYYKCKRKWTREQGEEISIIDYVITSQEYMETIKSMEMKKKNIESTK